MKKSILVVELLICNPKGEEVSGNTEEIVPAINFYDAPLDLPINLEHSTARSLVIHDSAHGAQNIVDAITAELPAGSFDRLAFPNPSEKITRGSGVVIDWMEILEDKHDFYDVFLIEPANRNQKAARSVLREAFPELNIDVYPLKLGDKELASAIAIHCADPRFQPLFSHQMHVTGEKNSDRLSLPGGALALRRKEVMHWVTESLRPGGIGRVVLMDHIDCAIAGGLGSYHNIEYDEALVHVASFNRTEKKIRDSELTEQPRISEYLFGVEGKLNVRELKTSPDLRKVEH